MPASIPSNASPEYAAAINRINQENYGMSAEQTRQYSNPQGGAAGTPLSLMEQMRLGFTVGERQARGYYNANYELTAKGRDRLEYLQRKEGYLKEIPKQSGERENTSRVSASSSRALGAKTEIIKTPDNYKQTPFDKGAQRSQEATGTTASYGYYGEHPTEKYGMILENGQLKDTSVKTRSESIIGAEIPAEFTSDSIPIAQKIESYNKLAAETSADVTQTNALAMGIGIRVNQFNANPTEEGYEPLAADVDYFNQLVAKTGTKQAATMAIGKNLQGQIDLYNAKPTTFIYSSQNAPNEYTGVTFPFFPGVVILPSRVSEQQAPKTEPINPYVVSSVGGMLSIRTLSPVELGVYDGVDSKISYVPTPVLMPVQEGQPTDEPPKNEFEERYNYHTQNIKNMIKNNVPFAGDIDTALNLAKKSLDEMANEQTTNAVSYTSNPAVIPNILSGIAGIPKETIEYGSVIPAFMAASQDINTKRNQIGLMRLKGGETLPDIVKTQDDYGYGEFVSKNAGGAIVFGGFTALTVLQPELKSMSVALPEKTLTRGVGLAAEKVVDAGIKTAIGLQFAAEPKETIQTLGPFVLVGASPKIAEKIIEPARFTELDLSFKTKSLEKLKVSQEPREVTSVYDANMQAMQRKIRINQGDLTLSKLNAITDVKSTQMIELPISDFFAKEFGLPTEMKVPFTKLNQYQFTASGKLRMFVGKDEFITPASITKDGVASSKSIVAKGIGEADLTFYPSQKIQYTGIDANAMESTQRVFMKREGGGRYAQDRPLYEVGKEWRETQNKLSEIPKDLQMRYAGELPASEPFFYNQPIDFSAPSKVRVYAKYPKIGSSKTGIAISRPFGEAQPKPVIEPSIEYTSPLSELPSIGEAPKPATLTAMDYVDNIPTPSNKGGVIEITRGIREIQYGKGNAKLRKQPLAGIKLIKFNGRITEPSIKVVDLSGNLVRYKSVSITKSGARLSEYETKFTDLTAQTTESGGLIRYEATTKPEWEIMNGKRFRIKSTGIGTIKTLEPASTAIPIGTEVEVTPINFEGGLSQVIHTPPTAKRGMKPWVELKPKEVSVTSSGNQMMKQVRGETPTKVGKSMQDTINAYATSHAQAVTSSVRAQAMEMERANIYPPNTGIQTPYIISIPKTESRQNSYQVQPPKINYAQRNNIIIIQRQNTLERGLIAQKSFQPQRFQINQKESTLERLGITNKGGFLERGSQWARSTPLERGGITEKLTTINLQKQPHMERIPQIQRPNTPNFPNFGITTPPPPPPPPWKVGGMPNVNFGDLWQRKTRARKRKAPRPKYTPSIISVVTNYRAKVPKGYKGSKFGLTGLEIRPIPI